MFSNAFPRQSQPEPRDALASGSGCSVARRAGTRPTEPVSLPVHFQEHSLSCVLRRNHLALFPFERGPRLDSRLPQSIAFLFEWSERNRWSELVSSAMVAALGIAGGDAQSKSTRATRTSASLMPTA
jgi:hypothetical protein